MLIFSVLSILVFQTGCQSINVPGTLSRELIRNGEIVGHPMEGIMVVSVGRRDTGIFGIPFVDYTIYQVLGPTEEPLRKGTIQAEVVSLGRIRDEMGPDKYGWTHIRQLPAGNYILVGARAANSMMVPTGTGVAFIPALFSNPDLIAFFITIEPGKLNYVGEILTVDRPKDISDFVVSDQSSRDLATVIKREPGLSDLEVRIALAQSDLPAGLSQPTGL